MAIDDAKLKMLDSPYGLDVMDAADQVHEETLRTINHTLNQNYAICFSTPTGKKVLEHLKRCTIEQPAWIPGDGDTGVHNAFIREGQNSIVRSIMDRIDTITKVGKK
jgi:3-hydroxy-3-methylglutaryl CoA synthase